MYFKPTAQGVIIGFGACGDEGTMRANRAEDYVVNTRGIDAGRISVVDGGCRSELKVELWIVRLGQPSRWWIPAMRFHLARNASRSIAGHVVVDTVKRTSS